MNAIVALAKIFFVGFNPTSKILQLELAVGLDHTHESQRFGVALNVTSTEPELVALLLAASGEKSDNPVSQSTMVFFDGELPLSDVKIHEIRFARNIGEILAGTHSLALPIKL